MAGRAVTCIAYGSLVAALTLSNLGCESTPQTVSTVGPPAATGPEATPPHPELASVTSISPRIGTGGSRITINGTGFTFTKTVCFGDAASPNYLVNDSGTRMTAVVPPGSGTVPVAIITGAGTSAARPVDSFTYRSSAIASGATSSTSPVSPCASMPPETSP